MGKPLPSPPPPGAGSPCAARPRARPGRPVFSRSPSRGPRARARNLQRGGRACASGGPVDAPPGPAQAGSPMRTLGTLLLSMALFTLACGGTTSDGVYRTPIVERGVCATILMPGQTMPMPEPGETSGCQGGYTSIAGGGVVEESQKTTKTEPHPVMKAIGAPFAVLLFPFKLAAAGAGKLGDLVSDDAEEVPMDPRLRERQAQVAKVDPQAAHEREQLSALEREIEQRGGKTRARSSGPALEAGTAQSSVPGCAAPAGARPSIAAELAALRGGPGGNAPPPAPAPAVSAAAPQAPSFPSPESAPALPPADRVLDRDGDGR